MHMVAGPAVSSLAPVLESPPLPDATDVDPSLVVSLRPVVSSPFVAEPVSAAVEAFSLVSLMTPKMSSPHAAVAHSITPSRGTVRRIERRRLHVAHEAGERVASSGAYGTHQSRM
jgi:hypothetical protein